MHGGQLRHLAGPDQHGLFAGHLAEDALGQFHGGVADGHRAGPDAGGRAHFFGHGKGLVAQPVDDDPGGAAGHGVAVGGLELPEYLRFAEHQGIKSRGHAKQVVHGGHALVGIQMRGQKGRVLAALAGPGRQHRRLGIAPHGIDHQHFHPVTGGKDQGLAHAGFAVNQKLAKFRPLAQGERFPNLYSGGLMVEAKQVNLLLHRYIAQSCGVWA